MVTFHSLSDLLPGLVTRLSELKSLGGVARRNSQVEPQLVTDQSGASRSVSPVWAVRERMLWEVWKRVSGVESWYLSAKIGEGRVRWVWRVQVSLLESLSASAGMGMGMGGWVSADSGMVMVMTGWRDVGWLKETVYLAFAESGSGWCRDGKENMVGAVVVSYYRIQVITNERVCYLHIFSSSPTAARRPPIFNSSYSVAFSAVKIPTSTRPLPPPPPTGRFRTSSVHPPSGGVDQYPDSVNDRVEAW